MKNKGRALRIVSAVGMFAAGASAYLFFSVVFPSALQQNIGNMAAIAIKSWSDAFGTSHEEYVFPEIKLENGEMAQDARGTQNLPVLGSGSPPAGEESIQKENASGKNSAQETTAAEEKAGRRSPRQDTGQRTEQSEEQGTEQGTEQGAAATPKESIPQAPTRANLTARASSSARRTSQNKVAARTPAQPTTASSPPPPQCRIASTTTTSFTRKIIFNEIAWMGSLPLAGESALAASNREWIEIKNNSHRALDISRWQIIDAAGNIKIVFGEGASIPLGGLFLLERGDDAIPTLTAQKIYTGALPNTGDLLVIFDAACSVSDLLDASAGWPGGDNATKRTLERDADGEGWHTSVAPGGTPKAENSVPIPIEHLVTVSMAGQGAGIVSSNPPGILCGFDCKKSYTSGTLLNFVGMPDFRSAFAGWSGGPCSGKGSCSFVVRSSIALAANFDLIAPVYPLPSLVSLPHVFPSPPAPSSTPSSTPSSMPALLSDHPVILGIRIAGASSTNDFVKIFNPTAHAIDVGRWKLRKKTSTGSDISLRQFPASSTIAAHGYFLWANSIGGFSESIGAQASSTETLAADNSVALVNASGTIVDAVAWGTGVDQYVEGSAYPVNPPPDRVLARRATNECAAMDTDNNAADFAIQ